MEEEKVEKKEEKPKKAEKKTKKTVVNDNEYILDDGRPVVPTEQNRNKKLVAKTYAELEKVKVKFMNLEAPGLVLKNVFFKMWKDAGRQFTFVDGGTYMLPKIMVDYVNKTCQVKHDEYKSYDGRDTSTAKPVRSATMPDFYKQSIVKERRYMFQEIL